MAADMVKILAHELLQIHATDVLRTIVDRLFKVFTQYWAIACNQDDTGILYSMQLQWYKAV